MTSKDTCEYSERTVDIDIVMKQWKLYFWMARNIDLPKMRM